MDAAGHKKYLDYRERHSYFGKMSSALSAAAFLEGEEEWAVLEALGARRDDEEEARYVDLTILLHRD